MDRSDKERPDRKKRDQKKRKPKIKFAPNIATLTLRDRLLNMWTDIVVNPHKYRKY